MFKTNILGTVICFCFPAFFLSCAQSSTQKSTPGTIQAIKIMVYNPYPPKNQTKDLHTFVLTTAEIKAFSKVAPPLSEHNNTSCDCGIPRFTFKVIYKGGNAISGHFFHGPDKLKVSGTGGAGTISGTKAVYEFLVTLIKKRSLWGKTSSTP